jgi:hypothetical protein
MADPIVSAPVTGFPAHKIPPFFPGSTSANPLRRQNRNQDALERLVESPGVTMSGSFDERLRSKNRPAAALL